jgi:hypothetical protein
MANGVIHTKSRMKAEDYSDSNAGENCDAT